jgi:chromosome partitioning protein
MRSLVFFNHAGGVGKTSGVRDVGYTLAAQGFRVLLIDADPQANLTEWLGVMDDVALEQTIFPAVISSGGNRSDLKLPRPLRVHGLDLIPSQLDVARLDVLLVGELNGLVRLRNAVGKLEGYDFVLIDPPPSLGQLSTLSVIAADHVIVPLPTNSKGLRGINTVVTMVDRFSELSPRLRISLFLLTQFDQRTRHDQESLEAIRTQLRSIACVSSPLHNRPATYKDAQLAGLPIPVFKPGEAADQEIRSATNDLLEVLGIEVAR